MKRILMTGFEPFGDWKINPSWDALELAENRGLFDRLEVSLARIPVTYGGAFAAFERAVREHQPVAAVSFGLHGGMRGRDADAIYIETTARNRDGAGKADNAGVMRAAIEIEPGSPPQLQSTLPMSAMIGALKRAGFNAQSSDDAGAYLCNHLFYRGALLCGGRFPYGFIHVPPVESQGGVLTLEQLARVAAAVAGTVAAAVIEEPAK
ncbi:MAG: pyroglutamyl-peptidase I [Planctomycetes bacterium]|nr:pyroglutamyl-peptidase I [Planctomycetota bacterium]MCW8135715.1 pyroglutamyl-peptidase I [Planctomycetota bacterium]